MQLELVAKGIAKIARTTCIPGGRKWGWLNKFSIHENITFLYSQNQLGHNLQSNQWLKNKIRKKQIELWARIFQWSHISFSKNNCSTREILALVLVFTQRIRALVMMNWGKQSFKRKVNTTSQTRGTLKIMGNH